MSIQLFYCICSVDVYVAEHSDQMYEATIQNSKCFVELLPTIDIYYQESYFLGYHGEKMGLLLFWYF